MINVRIIGIIDFHLYIREREREYKNNRFFLAETMSYSYGRGGMDWHHYSSKKYTIHTTSSYKFTGMAERITELLGETIRIKVQERRVIEGQFQCIDKDMNIG